MSAPNSAKTKRGANGKFLPPHPPKKDRQGSFWFCSRDRRERARRAVFASPQGPSVRFGFKSPRPSDNSIFEYGRARKLRPSSGQEGYLYFSDHLKSQDLPQFSCFHPSIFPSDQLEHSFSHFFKVMGKGNQTEFKLAFFPTSK
jgi:hypothetical protein